MINAKIHGHTIVKAGHTAEQAVSDLAGPKMQCSSERRRERKFFPLLYSIGAFGAVWVILQKAKARSMHFSVTLVIRDFCQNFFKFRDRIIL